MDGNRTNTVDGRARRVLRHRPMAWLTGLVAVAAISVACTEQPPPTLPPNGGVVTTFAGSPGQPGAVDGTGSAARFIAPAQSSFDHDGNLVVADHTSVRSVTPSGVVTTLAGGAQCGLVDGVGTAARFCNAHGIAVNSVGDVFVTDVRGIRRISPGGVVTTFFDRNVECADVPCQPSGLAIDSADNLYTADVLGHTIMKISPAGVASTIAGTPDMPGDVDATGADARFDRPVGIALDATGNLYVTEIGNHDVRKVAPTGAVATLAGAGSCGWTDGTGTDASFCAPDGIAVDAQGDLYVVAYGNFNSTVRRVTAAGVVTTLAGSTTMGSADGTGAAAEFRNPHGIALDRATGALYVSDSGNQTIREVS